MTDYLDGTMGQYYTQRWYIARRDYGSINLCTYDPPSGKDDVINGPHWYRVNTTDDYYYPTSAQLEAALQNSENHEVIQAISYFNYSLLVVPTSRYRYDRKR